MIEKRRSSSNKNRRICRIISCGNDIDTSKYQITRDCLTDT